MEIAAGFILGILAGIISAYLYDNYLSNPGGISWKQVEKAVENIVSQVSSEDYHPEIIIGVGRSGAIAASMISGNLGPTPVCPKGVPVIALPNEMSVLKGEGGVPQKNINLLAHLDIGAFRVKQVMVAYSVTDTGHKIDAAVEPLRQSGIAVRTASLFLSKKSTYPIDYPGQHFDAKQLDKYFSELPWMISANYRKPHKQLEMEK